VLRFLLPRLKGLLDGKLPHLMDLQDLSPAAFCDLLARLLRRS
jgi:hypothetical protein